MGRFRKCPRCDLNYITDDKEYCDICTIEMAGHAVYVETEEEDLGDLCPKCKQNYIGDGERICDKCQQAELEKSKVLEEEPDWVEEPEDDDDALVPPDEVSFDDLAEEEIEEDLDDPAYPADDEDDLEYVELGSEFDGVEIDEDDEDEEEDEE